MYRTRLLNRQSSQSFFAHRGLQWSHRPFLRQVWAWSSSELQTQRPGRYLALAETLPNCGYRTSAQTRLYGDNSGGSGQADSDPPAPSEYVLNVGRSTQVLQRDLAHIFRRGIQDPTIYTPQMTINEPYHTGLHLAGKRAYLWFVRCILRIIKWSYTDIDFRIIKMEHRPGPWNDNSQLPPSDSVIPPSGGGLETSPPSQLHSIRIQGQFAEQSHPPNTTQGIASPPPSSAGPIHRFSSNHGQLKPMAPLAPPTGDDTIVHLYVRWSFEATLRPSALLTDVPDFPSSQYEGVFVYSFDDRTGWVCKHTIVEIFPYPNHRLIRYLQRWWGWALMGPLRPKPV
ncbi:hypothetical protein H4R33_003161 [Dimargaris cristalligena]|uniref:Uncharacterized protein n=1 Tax=Dimargaris cristalligena TaxID=215637 RepID=A0A4P9ZLM4_9FUNG|nr:hypothetical protein H4R33_003161 [Dimargaris cristalligena]RKP34204.1 hypothetical protein BJ085DRAFT_39383 [Dimargaris cristalligena]|eukprot:RKP34204.1 hypothetical protein BJ085DRAFT_39383 [Dimargaris cristalligena]